ncbi:hypothetical protein ERX46_05920 [Brumimicrobium glaciale]|uniref:HutD family protein n=1 Tax=Brumimicrobium glaciale TaxID=200475 RepID=A0A4Q4KNB2_9FLAO|nr:HutD family protein [Brumimicrobium glaciale]RYM34911.1 hypothetical protein ERX46_05920 [Brumimicrobium glaciale]
MKFKILTPKNFQTTNWSGGTTTQLYISPESATLANKDFNLRISTAKVEANESTFTSLPGINRKLMILEGGITISHEDQYSKHLKPFDVDTFKGDWKTTSIGTCTDFNVMTTGDKEIGLYPLRMNGAKNFKFAPLLNCKDLFFYATNGNITVEISGEDYLLQKGNLLVIQDFDVPSIAISSDEAFGIVVVQVNK